MNAAFTFPECCSVLGLPVVCSVTVVIIFSPLFWCPVVVVGDWVIHGISISFSSRWWTSIIHDHDTFDWAKTAPLYQYCSYSLFFRESEQVGDTCKKGTEVVGVLAYCISHY